MEHLTHAEKYTSYCYECLLISWTGKDEHPWHDQQFTSWIDSHGPKEGFDLEFEFPEGTEQWLLFMHHRGKAANGDTGFMPAQGMNVVESGTMIPADLELLAAREKEKQQQPIISTRKEEDNVVRVKARGLLKKSF